jgi:arginyl-tRNA synthetase
MLDDKGNTAVYLLYAYTRIKSIARKAEVTVDALKNWAKSNTVSLAHEKEQKLVKVSYCFS